MKKIQIFCDKKASYFINLVKGHRFMSEFKINQEIKIDSKYLDECIFRIAENDLSYMNELYEHTHVSIYSYALSILKNRHDAEDVTHDCYVTVYNSAHQYRSNGKPLAWLITITRNLALARLNEKKRYDDKDISEYQIADEKSMSSVDKITLETCLNSLNDEERQVVILHAISGFKHREIATILDMSLSGVLSKYNRAMKKLKTQYEKGMKYELQRN